MKATIVSLDYNSDVRQTEEEIRYSFLRDLLERMTVPIQEIWSEDIPLNAAQKLKLAKLLTEYNIQIIDDMDGLLQVYVDGELAGEWKKCTFKIKKDLTQRDRKKQLYLEMTVNCWSLFEDSETQEQ